MGRAAFTRKSEEIVTPDCIAQSPAWDSAGPLRPAQVYGMGGAKLLAWAFITQD